MSSTTTMADDRRFTKHGFPKGFRFVPTQLELITILSHKIHGRRLHPKVHAIFHELGILDHHPKELHDRYERDKEHCYIYFFSRRRLQKTAGDAGGGLIHKKRQQGAAGQDDNDNEPRPVRLAKGGGWKPSGGGHVLRWPKDKGGFVAGKMVTMVFYDHHGGEQVKSQWGMHEFTVPVDPRQLSDSKTTKTHELALYRLYKIKSDDMESDDGARSSQTPANVAAAAGADGGDFSAPCPAGQPSFGSFTGRNQTLAAGPSTSRMPPPPPLLQQQLDHIPNVGHPQNYHHHRQYAFGAAPASAAHQRVRTMTMPPAYGAGMLPGRQLFPFARPPGTGLPGRQSLQFAIPPAPPQMPVPPAAANPASHSHLQQAPATATYGGGAGKEASHSGATRSLLSAPVSTRPPRAAEIPSAEEPARMKATHGVAGGQEAGDDFGATRCSLAAGSRPAERDATATAEPGQHVEFADCVKPEEETVPPPIPADDFDDGVGSQDWDPELFDERFLFTMEELCPTLDEPPLTQGENK